MAVAAGFDAVLVRKLRIRGDIRPHGTDGWRVLAEVGATVVQSCVVSLEDVVTRVDEKTSRVFLPKGDVPAELDFAPESEDDPDPLPPEGIDLGAVAVETISLALPIYPRTPDAVMPDMGDGEGEKNKNPFSVLAALKDQAE